VQFYEWFEYKTACVVFLFRNGGCMLIMEGPRMAYVYKQIYMYIRTLNQFRIQAVSREIYTLIRLR
jgi:hypothetical protein